jgi:hypothetical protein
MRLPLLILLIVFGLQSIQAQSVFTNPYTDLVERVLNEHQSITAPMLDNASRNRISSVESRSVITADAPGSVFKVEINHPTNEWEWTWSQPIGQREELAKDKYKLMVKQLSNSIINFQQKNKSAVLHIKSTSVDNSTKAYFELLPTIESVRVILELKYEGEWLLEMKVVQLKTKNEYAMN